MKSFKSLNDLSKIPSAHPARNIIQRLVRGLITGRGRYDPEADGYVVLIDRNDVGRVLHEIWPDRMLIDVLWEGVHLECGHYVAVWLADNQFGIAAVIPDEEWTGDDLRAVLEDNLVPLPEN